MKKVFYLSAAAILFCSNAMLFAQGDVEATPPRDNLWQTVSWILIAIFSFYFILWRPEQKRRKQQEAQRTSLKKGDRVYAMGIVGTVSKIQEHTIIVRMVDGSKIEFLKAAITDVMPGTEEDIKKVEKD